ncbi:MAG TPA: twin-arginine translocation signal domain-containing protein, partial [Burkholderiaceae bacterium]|nr:twin-arginine translocation signal domain-containing protein [Burkholderiaceae bacterium]
MRRIFLKFVSTASVALGASTMLGKQALAADPVKVVYHLSEGLDQASRALANMRNHLRADSNTRIVVVAHGEGVRFLLEG